LSRHAVVLIYGLVLPLLAGGCRAAPFWPRPTASQLPPAAFSQTPTLEDVIYVVNANTQRVQRLQTENATLRVEGLPTLRANLAYESPRNFRLRADLSRFTGRELDLGSNHDLFWLWIRREEPPSVYFARHDEFALSPASDLVPIEPHRLMEALGLVTLDAQVPHLGPFPQESSLLEVRSRIPAPRGDLSRVLLIDAKYGWVVQQHLYDAAGQLLFAARAGRHRYYPEDAVTMPHWVEVRLLPGQPSQLAFEVDVSNYLINRLSGDPGELWVMPVMEGSRAINLADPAFRPALAAPPPGPPTGPAGLSANHWRAADSAAPVIPRGAGLSPYRGYQTYLR
jgi:hypothetical protein